ncbi:MAG: hypothetical protein LBG19_01955 [Prevotellaceae bacterium]|jgi:nucleoside transporter|nr:hypothetical protein [Prevotellaceae bacterium]
MKKIFLLLFSAIVAFPLCTDAQEAVADSMAVAMPPATEFIEEEVVIASEQNNENLNHYKAILEKKEMNISFGSVLKGLLGMAVILLIAWIFSTNRRKVAWGSVGRGLLLTIIIAYMVLQPPPTLEMGGILTSLLFAVGIGLLWMLCKGVKNLSPKRLGLSLIIWVPILFVFFQFVPVQSVFEFLGKCFTIVLGWTRAGSEFLLGPLVDVNRFGYVFAFQILPTIVFFSALTSLFFYLGIIQKVVWLMAWGLTKALRLSGAESLAVAGNIFVGQTESPLLVKAYIPTMTKSEIMLVMTAGMATMAGGVLAAYIQMLGNGDPVLTIEFAKHLLSASVMAAPGAVVVSKILVPQTEEINNKVEVSKEKLGKNVLDAVSNGATEGLKLAANVAAMLLVFYALIAGVNYIFAHTGRLELPRLVGVFAAFVVGISASYMFRHKISGNGKIPQSVLLSIVVGLGLVASVIFYYLFTLFVPTETIGGMTAFICWFTIAAILGFYIGVPCIMQNKVKRLHLTNGAFALIFIGLFTLMLNWKEVSNNLNSVIAATTNGGYNSLSIEFILGYAFAPIMWLIGVCSEDATIVGQLMGQKLILTEFVAYGNLADLIKVGAFTEVKSVVMATYILCGFANFASIGIQIGGIGSLAPNKKPLLAQFGMHALLGGTLAALVSATMVGIILG